eukprot:CAMPEP_0183728016 /NCGR_PEP_ID=MMETSP0737-20130205/26992_1 /TAXON_ID=385413 /ORGANISM="Thalassiosira miniscula, Strain CCMP1093" /LENGTH=762 /DNA_ID=CAMNT_0025959825 /DNA_START=51 /DNA_END=2339 /DNA_ORIENTATION=-
MEGIQIQSDPPAWNGERRNFNCDELDPYLNGLCTPDAAATTCRSPFEINICTVNDQEQKKICQNGYATEFISNFPCYCGDRCLAKIGATVSGSIFGFSLLVGVVCVLLRHRSGRKITEEEMKRRLNVKRSEKPDPRVSSFSMSCFKWIPFTTSVIITVWFIVSTGIVISMNGYVEVSQFQVAYMFISTTFMCFWLASNICLAINGINGFRSMKKALAKGKKNERIDHSDTVQHLVVLPNYCEDVNMMRHTILRVAKQSFINVEQNVTIVLGMEQGEEGYWEKAKALREEFLPMFQDVIVTCHPRLNGEQPGKSSNMKWSYAALRKFAISNNNNEDTSSETLEELPRSTNGDINYVNAPESYFSHPDLVEKTIASPGFIFDPDNTIVTLMDADALSHHRFLATLTSKFEKKEGSLKHLRFWQCPVAFYENLAEVDFINRAVSIIFAFNELANMSGIDLGLVGCKPRVPVNTYSMSWRLFDLIDGGDNFVVADESHNLFKSHHFSKGLARLEPIPLPISVYNVTSDKFFEGFKARFVQIKRWMYGNAYEFSFWTARYVGCSRSSGWDVPLLDKLPILWRLFIYSSFNLVQPLFFALYGLSWAFYLQTPYFQTLATVFVTCIMTTFMIINVSIFLMHWLLVKELGISGIQAWPAWKKAILTIWDAIIGVGAATIFFVFMAGLAASGQMLFSGGLKWGTEGRAQVANSPDEEDDNALGENLLPKPDDEVLKQSFQKLRSTRTVKSALANSQLLMDRPVVDEVAGSD